jgi:hypothetical protein
LRGETSYIPVALEGDLKSLIQKMRAEKPQVLERQMQLLSSRYDLSDRPATGVTMSRGKPIQAGVRVKLPQGMT